MFNSSSANGYDAFANRTASQCHSDGGSSGDINFLNRPDLDKELYNLCAFMLYLLHKEVIERMLKNIKHHSC